MIDFHIAVAFGGVIGLLVGILPRPKAGLAVLFFVPVAMIYYTQVELSRPGRQPDALDSLLYFFNPLWPSLAALTGFALGRFVHRLASRKRPR